VIAPYCWFVFTPSRRRLFLAAPLGAPRNQVCSCLCAFCRRCRWPSARACRHSGRVAEQPVVRHAEFVTRGLFSRRLRAGTRAGGRRAPEGLSMHACGGMRLRASGAASLAREERHGYHVGRHCPLWLAGSQDFRSAHAARPAPVSLHHDGDWHGVQGRGRRQLYGTRIYYSLRRCNLVVVDATRAWRADRARRSRSNWEKDYMMRKSIQLEDD
jgi:hypothetical protein